MHRWGVACAVAVTVNLVVGCSSGAEDQVASTMATEPTTPGWDAYVGSPYENHLTSAIWNGEEMVLVGFDHSTPEFRNVLAAYHPASGSWSELPALPTDVPVTVNAMEPSKLGVVVAGLGCDPETSVDSDDDLVCSPGDLRTYLQPHGEDAFVALETPVRAQSRRSIPELVQGTRGGNPYLRDAERLYRLTDSKEWELVDSSGEGGPNLCQVGDQILGTVAGAGQGEGRPRNVQLATFDAEAERWTPIDLPTHGSSGSLRCGNGSSALFRITNEDPAVDSAFIVSADAPPVEITIEAGLHLDNITFDGKTFLTTGTFITKDVTPYTAGKHLYVFDPGGGPLRESSHPVRPAQTIEAFPMDGKVALYSTSTATEAAGITHEREVRTLIAAGD